MEDEFVEKVLDRMVREHPAKHDKEKTDNWKDYRKLDPYGDADVMEELATIAVREMYDLIIRECKIFEKDLITHPLLDSHYKQSGSATIHDFIYHLRFVMFRTDAIQNIDDVGSTAEPEAKT